MNLYKKLFIIIFFATMVAVGCAPTFMPVEEASDTAKIEATTTMQPSATLMPTLVLLTETAMAQADQLTGKYLFPDEIDSKIAEVIQAALEKRLGWKQEHIWRGRKQFFSYALFTPLKKSKDGTITAYAQVEYRVFYVEHGALKEGGGGDIPAAVIMEEQENGWDVQVLTPKSGNWGDNIREIFPEEIHPLIFDHSAATKPVYEAIYHDIVQQAEETFGLVFDEDKNSLQALGVNDVTPSVVILTVTPTPTTDISLLEAEISTDVFVTDEHITISVDLYRGYLSAYQRGLLSADWAIQLYKRQTDNHYNPKDAIVLTHLMESARGGEFAVQISLEEVRHRFGDARGLIYQVVDKTGKVFFQDEIYINHNLNRQSPSSTEKSFSDAYSEYVNQGLILGFPNLFSETVIPVFLTEDNIITVKEPHGGFHSLHFEYGFAQATGITSTNDLQTLSENLVIQVFPYQESDSYSSQEAIALKGKISGVSGVLQASFPHAWLDEKSHRVEQKFYLRIGDKNGNIYKEAYILFIPYTP